MKTVTTAIGCALLLVITTISCRTSKATLPGEFLTTTTWQLSQMNGKAVDASVYQRGMPYVMFSADNKISGNSGCNSFSGSYNLNDVGGMNVSKIVATKMFCEGVNESEFFTALEKVNMSKAEKDKLTLMNGVDEVLIFVPKQ